MEALVPQENIGFDKSILGFDNSILIYEDKITFSENIENIEILFDDGDKIILDLENGVYSYDGITYAFSIHNINFKLLEEQYGKIEEIILPNLFKKYFSNNLNIIGVEDFFKGKVGKTID